MYRPESKVRRLRLALVAVAAVTAASSAATPAATAIPWVPTGFTYEKHLGGEFAEGISLKTPGGAWLMKVAMYAEDRGEGTSSTPMLGWCRTNPEATVLEICIHIVVAASRDRWIVSQTAIAEEPPAEVPEFTIEPIDLDGTPDDGSPLASMMTVAFPWVGPMVTNLVTFGSGWKDVVLSVSAEEGSELAMSAGEVFAATDETFTSGLLDAQAQASVVKTPLGFRVGAGAKAIKDATIETTLPPGFIGFFGNLDFKTACAGVLTSPTCIRPLGGASAACTTATGFEGECRTSRISYEGPAGSGCFEGVSCPPASHAYFMFTEPPGGEYRFTIDRKLDAYTPDGVSAWPMAEVGPYEDTTYLILTTAWPPTFPPSIGPSGGI